MVKTLLVTCFFSIYLLLTSQGQDASYIQTEVVSQGVSESQKPVESSEANETQSVASSHQELQELSFLDQPDRWVDQKFGPYLDEVTGKVFYSIEVTKDSAGNPVKLPLVVIWLGVAAVIITILL